MTCSEQQVSTPFLEKVVFAFSLHKNIVCEIFVCTMLATFFSYLMTGLVDLNLDQHLLVVTGAFLTLLSVYSAGITFIMSGRGFSIILWLYGMMFILTVGLLTVVNVNMSPERKGLWAIFSVATFLSSFLLSWSRHKANTIYDLINS